MRRPDSAAFRDGFVGRNVDAADRISQQLATASRRAARGSPLAPWITPRTEHQHGANDQRARTTLSVRSIGLGARLLRV